MHFKDKFSRRNLLQGAAAVGGGLLASRLSGGILPRTAFAQAAPEKPALVAIFLQGGFNSVFGSADSYRAAGTFGITGDAAMKAVSGGLVVDAATFGTLTDNLLAHMATVGVRHGISAHGAAQQADWTDGTRSYPLRLSAALGGEGAIKCAVVGSRMPAGPRPVENGVSMQSITDMSSTIAALGGATTDPTVPDRAIAAKGIVAAQAMSDGSMTQSPVMLTSLREGYAASIDTLQKPQQQFDFAAMAQAYGVAANTRSVNNFTNQMLAAELMITAGATSVIAIDNGWDTHGDRSAATVRNQMNSRILPGLKVFLSRMVDTASAQFIGTGRNVVVTIFGDFARSLPGSDHASALSTTVIGKYVKAGSTGKMAANVTLPAGTPSVPGYWAYLARVLKAPTEPFGANPHTAIAL